MALPLLIRLFTLLSQKSFLQLMKSFFLYRLKSSRDLFARFWTEKNKKYNFDAAYSCYISFLKDVFLSSLITSNTLLMPKHDRE